MKGLISAAVLAGCVCAARVAAQVLPGLGADGVVGSAGVHAVAPPGSLGLPPNPADIAWRDQWNLGFGASNSSVTGVAERSVTAAARVGRLGIAGRLNSRWVRNLFDDPALNDAPDLSVRSSDYAVGVSVSAPYGIAAGVSALYSVADILGSTGTGIGYTVGLSLERGSIGAGLTYGTAEPAMRWRGAGSAATWTAGTRRFAAGLSASATALGVRSGATVEWDREVGYSSASWTRANVSFSVLQGFFCLVGGVARGGGGASSYSEVGGLLTFGVLQLSLGARFGAQPVPGNSIAIGIGARASQRPASAPTNSPL